MHLRLPFKAVVLPPMTWLAMCLLVTSCDMAPDPVVPSPPPWPTGLITAIQANDLPAVKESLERGAEVNARDHLGSTPLMQAARISPPPDYFTQSLERGAEVNARDVSGSTPLIIAAEYSRYSSSPENLSGAIITLLLEKGAEIEARHHGGMTPLMSAARHSSPPAIVTLLLARGAQIEARDKHGWTPLMHAARFSDTPEMVTLLLEKGADALAKDEEGMKAIDHAEENDDLEGTPAYQQLLKGSRE